MLSSDFTDVRTNDRIRAGSVTATWTGKSSALEARNVRMTSGRWATRAASVTRY